MSVILAGHIHLYEPFDRTVFKTIIRTYRNNQEMSNRLEYCINPETDE